MNPEKQQDADGRRSPPPCSRLSEAIACVRKYNDWRRGKIDWEELMPEDVGRFLDEICDQAEDAEMKLKRVGKLAANALSTSWLYNGKDHVETQVRKIADICPENVRGIPRRCDAENDQTACSASGSPTCYPSSLSSD